ncbi:MAG: Flp pilus assembly complex ATPase component TadA [Deltaproteobacteria bacterium]|nr:Flp pilus assembly complex ATPase component TadA [Deltaproteobacteria bacterium]
MSKLDVYLRSIERFGAAGAILNSGQAVTLRFPTGDRNATQVTPHDQLVILVREVAPPAVLDQIDKQRPARFEVDSEGKRYSLSVSPKPGAWSVAIELAGAPAPAAAPPPPAAAARPAPPRAAAGGGGEGLDMAIERGQYDGGTAPAIVTSSGSVFLDQLTTTARGSRASDVYLHAGTPPLVRAGGELSASGPALDGDQLSREVGIVAPPEARAAWQDNRIATFAYGDGAGRVRVTLTRDHRGPGAALRLLHGEAPPLDRIGLAEVAGWLDGRGLIVIAGHSGSGKTTTLAALVRALSERRKTVVMLEDPTEVVHTGPTISQRAIGEHVHSFSEGVASAMREGADAIVVGTVNSSDAASAVIDAVAGGHLVLTTLVAPSQGLAIERLLDRLPVEQREAARNLLGDTLIGTIAPIVGRGGARTFEVARRGSGQ